MSKKSTASIYNWDAQILNNATMLMYCDMLADIASSFFVWDGLPETINARNLERLLLIKGKAIFFHDEAIGHLCLDGALLAPLDINNEMTNASISTASGYNRQLSKKDFVVIWNNYSRSGDMQAIRLYARRATEAERTCDINVLSQKTPTLVTCSSEQEELSLRNAMLRYIGNEPFIIAKSTITNGIKPYAPGTNFTADKITIIKRQIIAEAYQYFGIDSNAEDKKERLVEAEVESSKVQTLSNMLRRLKPRQEAAKEINAKYGLNIKCYPNSDYYSVYEELEKVEQEVDEGGEVHNQVANDN